MMKFLDALIEVKYPGLNFLILSKGANTFLQVESPEGLCNVTGEVLEAGWRGRKWYLSPHMTTSEIVQTAFLAVTQALEHEARERFTFKGQPVMDPHKNMQVVAQELRHEGLPQELRVEGVRVIIPATNDAP